MLLEELKKQYAEVKTFRPAEVELIRAYELIIADMTPILRPAGNTSSRFVFGL
jgi:hypothetical protein